MAYPPSLLVMLLLPKAFPKPQTSSFLFMEFVRTDQPLHPLYSNLNKTRSDQLFQRTKFVDLTALTPPSSNPFRASGTFNSPSSPMLSFGDCNSPVDSNVAHGIVTREDSIIRAHKRHNYLGEEQASKKHCIGIEKVKEKRAESIYSQSIAAKNRRQRISQRLRTLQELVPNGTKVDLVTMLETAISYVKFLQLQVKVLERDELWPSQEGNAETCEMKEAIDAIYRLQARKAWKSALQD